MEFKVAPKPLTVENLYQKLQWIIEKTTPAKNDNETIADYNDDILQYYIKLYYRIFNNDDKKKAIFFRNIKDKSCFIFLQNLINILLTKPQDIRYVLLTYIKNYKILECIDGPLAWLFSFVRKSIVCIKCEKKCVMKYLLIKKNRSKCHYYVCSSNSCDYQVSIWNDCWLNKFNKQTKMCRFLMILLYFGDDNKRKNIKIETDVSLRTITSITSFIRHSIHLFSNNHIPILGGPGMKVSADHTHIGGNNKYNRGSAKGFSHLYLGNICQETSIVVLGLFFLF